MFINLIEVRYVRWDDKTSTDKVKDKSYDCENSNCLCK
jgi:hypothetical protein